MYGDNPPLNFLEHLEIKGQEILRKVKEVAEKRNLVVTAVMLERADPADEILKLSERDSYDLIVLGTRGLSGIRKFLLGSVSSKITEHAKCAVLTVK